MGGKIDVFIGGMGTGGTLTGVGGASGTEPGHQDCWCRSGWQHLLRLLQDGEVDEAYTYTLEGIGEDFLPSTMDLDILDDCVRVTDQESFLMTRDIVRKEGISRWFLWGRSGWRACG